jgi:hypothetical protein
MAEKTTTTTTEQKVEWKDESVPSVDNESSAKELKENLTFKEDADLHPSGEPKSETEKEPGGPPATDPRRPPFATNHPQEEILTALATGSGQHTPPDPDTVDADGFVRPQKAEEKS